MDYRKYETSRNLFLSRDTFTVKSEMQFENLTQDYLNEQKILHDLIDGELRTFSQNDTFNIYQGVLSGNRKENLKIYVNHATLSLRKSYLVMLGSVLQPSYRV